MVGYLLKQILVYVIVFGGLGFGLFTYGKQKEIIPLKYIGLALCGIGGMMFLSGLVTAINGALFW